MRPDNATENTASCRGMIFDIRRYAIHDGPGIRTTVFLKGCPLNCHWCHNPEGIKEERQGIMRSRQLNGRQFVVKETAGQWMDAAAVMSEVLQDRLFYEESGGGVTFSGGEPLLQPVFLLHMLRLCREAGIHTAVDTCGEAPAAIFSQAARHTDLLLFDLKAAGSKLHEEHTGLPNRQIIRNLLSLTDSGPELIIRIPIIPGFNNSVKELKAMREMLRHVTANIKHIELLPYHHYGRHKYEALGLTAPRTGLQQVSLTELETYTGIFSEDGFKVVCLKIKKNE